MGLVVKGLLRHCVEFFWAFGVSNTNGPESECSVLNSTLSSPQYCCNTLFPPVCKNNWTGQELWQTHKCEYVNNIMNLYCRTTERGCAEKETAMAVEGTWKGGVNFH
jgi:hypothetical protein